MKAAAGTVEGLYVNHSAWLSAWLERRLRCPHRAAELSQDTFCRLLERLPDVAPASPRGYLATIARRLMLDDIRRRDIERAVLETYAAQHHDTDEITPERIVEAVRFLEQVLSTLDALPAATRRVLLLRRVEGLSHEEIAARTGMAPRSIRRHIATASVAMFELMAE